MYTLARTRVCVCVHVYIPSEFMHQNKIFIVFEVGTLAGIDTKTSFPLVSSLLSPSPLPLPPSPNDGVNRISNFYKKVCSKKCQALFF